MQIRLLQDFQKKDIRPKLEAVLEEYDGSCKRFRFSKNVILNILVYEDKDEENKDQYAIGFYSPFARTAWSIDNLLTMSDNYKSFVEYIKSKESRNTSYNNRLYLYFSAAELYDIWRIFDEIDKDLPPSEITQSFTVNVGERNTNRDPQGYTVDFSLQGVPMIRW